MDATNATATDQAYVVLIAWAHMLTQYVSAMGIVLLLYDCLLTIQDEVCLILLRLEAVSVYFLLQIRLVWPGGLNLTKGLYYINRYLTVAALLFCTYRE